MKRKKDDHVAHDLRDKPVPPVKGAVTRTQEDETVQQRPNDGQPVQPPVTDSVIFNGWL